MSGRAKVQTVLARYLKERRQLGFALNASTLMRFARYADAQGHRGPLTRELQINWAKEHVKRTGSTTRARRLRDIRPFVAYYRQFEPDTEFVDPYTFGREKRRITPHIYTDQEISDLIQASGRLSPQGGLRPATYQAFFGLIAATGLRLCETLDLRVADVDLAGATLTVRNTKFNKSRRLPLHPSVVQALRHYEVARNQAVSHAADFPFFVSQSGCAIPKRTVHYVFERLRDSLGWVARGMHPHPRIHDLRHTFAVRRMQLWHESGDPIEQRLFWLCTYLGHAKISDTYWYLAAVPELMAVAGDTFEKFANDKEISHEQT